MTKIERERRIVAKMVEIYCRGNHTSTPLCVECRELIHYAHARLNHCPFGEDKGVCNRCKVHCYKPSMRTRISEVMRYSGKRMVFHAPLAALWHLWRVLR